MQHLSNVARTLAEQTRNKVNVHCVHKFGGSSLATATSISRVVSIIKEYAYLDDLIVVSANGKTTNKLIALINAANDQILFNEKIEEIKLAHSALLNQLLNFPNQQQLFAEFAHDLGLLQHWQSMSKVEQNRNDVLAFGEVWSAKLLACLLTQNVCKAKAIDARDVLQLNAIDNLAVNETVSRTNLLAEKSAGVLNVLTGFIAQDEKGNSQTLGRNGSDYSATIAANLLHAKKVILWTDVDGIYSADPRVVTSARKLHRIENSVAKELGRLGNPVLHANTLEPLEHLNIPLHIASSFEPELTASKVGNYGEIAKQEISVTHNNDLVKISSSDLTAEVIEQVVLRFSAIYHCPDHTCIVVSPQFLDLTTHYLSSLNIEFAQEPTSLIAIVGYDVANRSDITARFKRSLEKSADVDFRVKSNAHSQIAFLKSPCSVETVNVVHNMVTKNSKTIGIIVVGVGNIGERFLSLLPKQLSKQVALENTHLVGLCSSKKALLIADGIDVNNALEAFNQHAKPYQSNDLVSWTQQHPFDELIVIDISASEAFSTLYQDFFEQGVHLISANKCAGSSSRENYNALINSQHKHGSHWLTNTTVGAGLPINHAIADLRQSGDQVNQIAGIFSGTLSWLFANFDGVKPFSELTLEALGLGLTEPDPRDDLSGLDVQRKLLILARQAGFDLSLEDIQCENLVPENLQSLSTGDFLTRINEIDDDFKCQLLAAQKQQACLRYIARFTVENNKVTAQVGLEVLPNNDPFANLSPCDNIFLLSTDWYQENPLIIRGPGAGRDVTAGGIHSDLVNLCRTLTTNNNTKGINS